MTLAELRDAIEHTKQQIHQLKRQISETTDLRELRKLKLRLKELQHLQLRNLEQLG